MTISIFTDKARQPNPDDLVAPLGETYELWKQIRQFILEKYPAGVEEWTYPGKNYGWNFRIKDKRRTIAYLLPREDYFKVAFVFGQKATDQVLASDVSPEIKTELSQARVYAEGRGIQIDVRDELKIPDIRQLVEIKLAN
jgi:hypothetical protein